MQMSWSVAAAWSAQPGMVWLLTICPLVLKVNGNPQSSLRRINHCVTRTCIPPHLAAKYAVTLLQLPSDRYYGQDETESQQAPSQIIAPAAATPVPQSSVPRDSLSIPHLLPQPLVSFLTLELKPCWD